MKFLIATILVLVIVNQIENHLNINRMEVEEIVTQNIKDDKIIKYNIDKNKIYKYDVKLETSKYTEEKTNEVEKKASTEARPVIQDIPLSEEILNYIWIKSEKEDIAFTFVLAIIGVESNYGRDTIDINNNGTIDSGIAQINSANINWLAELAGINNVDPNNDFHNIDMMFELLKYERNYWRKQGYSEEDVFILTCLSYNMGRGNTIVYIEKNGIKANEYVNKVLNEKVKLENKIYKM